MGRVVDYDETTGEVIIRAPADFTRLCQREVSEVEIILTDSRPLSSKQRRSVYAMIREIADYSGYTTDEAKEAMKLDFWTDELQQMGDRMFSLRDAPMSIVAAFQKWLARFIVAHDIPTRVSVLDYVDDTSDYVYACLIHKKCPICGRPADLHHVKALGAGMNRNEVIHEGLEVMPLCREHHMEVHRIGKNDFFNKYHLEHGIPADKTICKIYGLKRSKTE